VATKELGVADLMDQIRSIRLLLIDDDAVARTILARQLTERQFVVRQAVDGLSGLTIIRSGWPRAVVLDYVMPGLDGLAVVRQLRADPATIELPVILLTALDQPQTVVEAFEQGVDDYVGKPAHPDEVSVRLCRLLRLAARRQRLAQAATVDSLTGLLNRRGLDELAETLVDRAQQRGEELACLLFDLDHFKQINDRFGHAAGDEVLVEVARRLRGGLRQHDRAARYGGEELTVLLPGTAWVAAVGVAERLRRLIGAKPIMTAAGPVPVTTSGGVAMLGQPAGSWPELRERADAALYAAKAAGRDRIVLAGPMGQLTAMVGS
jgi:diguanylate cyclase (GGDEF)-like protein